MTQRRLLTVVAILLLSFGEAPFLGVANADAEKIVCRSKGQILAFRATTGSPVSGSMGLLAILSRALISSPG